MTQDDENTMTVLRFLVERDLGPDQFFTDRHGRIAISENCNDLFEWACAESEEITVADLPDYQQAIDDITAIDRTLVGHAGQLWACRKRGQQPQAPVMKRLPDSIRQLFEAIGTASGENRQSLPKPG